MKVLEITRRLLINLPALWSSEYGSKGDMSKYDCGNRSYAVNSDNIYMPLRHVIKDFHYEMSNFSRCNCLLKQSCC